MRIRILRDPILFSGRLTHAVIRSLDWLARHTLPPDKTPAHQSTGRRGEQDACFPLRRLGYGIVARNYRTPRPPGEIDLISWSAEVPCFIEVRTRKSRDAKAPKPPWTAINAAKWRP